MMKNKVLILFSVKTKKVVEMFTGSFVETNKKAKELTDRMENDGFMFVNEIKMKDSDFVREFANEQDGHIYDLILCGGVAKAITKL